MNQQHVDPSKNCPGFFKMRWLKDGPWVPARMWFEQQLDSDGNRVGDDIHRAEIDGQPCDPFDPPCWPWRLIVESEWQFMTADAAWCRTHRPDLPAANPKQPIDRRSAPRFA